MTASARIWNEGRSIHIGMDRVDDAVYRGWLPPLRCAGSDAASMRGVADVMGFASRLLVNEQATRTHVRDCIEATIERLVPGDVLMITYAGHMTTLAGIGDDADGWDEAWCLSDGILLDDEFHDLLAEAPEGADILVVTDSCYAAGMTDEVSAILDPSSPLVAASVTDASVAAHRRLPTSEWAKPSSGQAAVMPVEPVPASIAAIAGDLATSELRLRAPRMGLGQREIARLVAEGAIPRGVARPASQRARIRARVVALAAADESSLAFEDDHHGLFTAALLDAISKPGADTPTYAELLRAIESRVPRQRPKLRYFGWADESTGQTKAFIAEEAGPKEHTSGTAPKVPPHGETGSPV